MNSAEGIIHDTETKMEEYKDQLPADEVLVTCLLIWKAAVIIESNLKRLYVTISIFWEIISFTALPVEFGEPWMF